MASGMREDCFTIDCFICDEVEKLENYQYITLPTEVVSPRLRRRYLVIPNEYGPDFNEFIDVYDAYTLRDRQGNNLKREVNLFQKYLVELRNGEIVTKDNERGHIEIGFQDNQKYDVTKQYNITVDVCPHCQVGIFLLSPVIFDEHNPDMEAVDI